MDRIKFLIGFFAIFMAVIVFRLAYWQYFARDNLLAAAQGQYFQSLEIPAIRGEVLSNDQFPIVTNQEAYTLFAIISKLEKPPKEIAQKLAPLLVSTLKTPEDLENQNQDDEIKELEDKIYNQLSLKNQFQVQIATKLDKILKEQIESLQIAGLAFEKDQKRFYPEASMAAHLLGFVGSDNQGRSTGYFGLEGFYNDQLKGRGGVVKQERDVAGSPILIAPYQPVEPENGRTLVTTIDRTVQYIVENELAKAVKKYGAKAGSVIVMDPSSGAILAMATSPSYDPGKWQEFDSSLHRNPAVADSYEPGSTFKVIVMSAAINEKKVTPDTICDKCEGPREIGGFTLKTWNNKYYPNTNMTQVLEHSDNIGMVFVAEKLGPDKMISYLESFGFGKPTKIDLQEETSPKLRSKKDWKEIDLATSAFGQGISVTPIQMVRAIAAIANGGDLVQPHIVKKVITDDSEFEQKHETKKGIIKKETARIVAEMMYRAVENGEAKRLKPKNLKVAGKTGTAQIPVAGHYDPNKTIASFVGFAPVEKPKFVMLVRIDQPSTSPYGSETAAPTFFAIAKELLTYWGLSGE